MIFLLAEHCYDLLLTALHDVEPLLYDGFHLELFIFEFFAFHAFELVGDGFGPLCIAVIHGKYEVKLFGVGLTAVKFLS